MYLRLVGRLSLGLAAAAVFALAALGSWLVWYLTDYAGDWTVNVATELGALALTLAIVERIIQGESQARVRPLVENALNRMASSLEWITASIAVDYTDTHVDNFQSVPTDPVAVLDLWNAEQYSADTERRFDTNGCPYPISVAEVVLDDFVDVRRDYGDHLEPRLVLALDRLIRRLRNTRMYSAMASAAAPRDVSGRQALVMSTFVDSLRDFALELRTYGGLPPLDPDSRSLIDARRQQALVSRDAEK